MIRQFDSLFELFEAFPEEQAAIDHLRAIAGRTGRFAHIAIRSASCTSATSARISVAIAVSAFQSKSERFSNFQSFHFVNGSLRSGLSPPTKKGIASTTLARDLKITQKSAWFVLHRLRHAAGTNSFNRPLKGKVEIVETHFGGKEGNKHANKRTPGSQGGANKATVFGMLERGGELRVQKVDDLKAKTIRDMVRENVEPGGSTIISDEEPSNTGF